MRYKVGDRMKIIDLEAIEVGDCGRKEVWKNKFILKVLRVDGNKKLKYRVEDTGIDYSRWWISEENLSKIVAAPIPKSVDDLKVGDKFEVLNGSTFLDKGSIAEFRNDDGMKRKNSLSVKETMEDGRTYNFYLSFVDFIGMISEEEIEDDPTNYLNGDMVRPSHMNGRCVTVPIDSEDEKQDSRCTLDEDLSSVTRKYFHEKEYDFGMQASMGMDRIDALSFNYKTLTKEKEMKKRLYQYAVLLHPKKEGEGETEIILKPKFVLAKDKEEVKFKASRAIPKEKADDLDRIEIIIQSMS